MDKQNEKWNKKISVEITIKDYFIPWYLQAPLMFLHLWQREWWKQLAAQPSV